ncbi:MAG: transferase [Deltaproteobacteria bacterium]|nr:transferase [Deltaproteobacteria bacterium]
MEIDKLIDRIIDRVAVNLRETGMDPGEWVRGLVTPDLAASYAFYELTTDHPISFSFIHSCLSGSYFLGRCRVDHSVLVKTDVRGDELKRAGDRFAFQGREIPVLEDEAILIKDSFLLRTLVHNFSHDPENLEEFKIKNTVALHYANIHGAPVEGSFLAPFATIDLTRVHDCVIGAFSYVQTGELSHAVVQPGTVWIKRPDFEFTYRFDPDVLSRYVSVDPGKEPAGEICEFVREKRKAFRKVFSSLGQPVDCPDSSALSPYAVAEGDIHLGENVLVCQRAFLENAHLGDGANAQENCFVVNSTLQGFNITAHGGKVVHADLGKNGFVGFNAMVRGTEENPVRAGQGVVFMPHAIVDAAEPLDIPANTMVWGHVTTLADLEENSIPLEELKTFQGDLSRGRMHFSGNGRLLVEGFLHRIRHILEANGAFAQPGEKQGHAQHRSDTSFTTIRAYPSGDKQGIFPHIRVAP